MELVTMKEIWIVYIQDVPIDCVFETIEDAEKFVEDDMYFAKRESDIKYYSIVKYVRG